MATCATRARFMEPISSCRARICASVRLRMRPNASKSRAFACSERSASTVDCSLSSSPARCCSLPTLLPSLEGDAELLLLSVAVGIVRSADSSCTRSVTSLAISARIPAYRRSYRPVRRASSWFFTSRAATSRVLAPIPPSRSATLRCMAPCRLMNADCMRAGTRSSAADESLGAPEDKGPSPPTPPPLLLLSVLASRLSTRWKALVEGALEDEDDDDDAVSVDETRDESAAARDDDDDNDAEEEE